MRTFKIIVSFFLITLLILPLYQCKKNETMSFGTELTNLKVDSVYKANTDGFLSVQYTNNVIGLDQEVVIYSDTSKNPKTKVADITITSLTTLPIPKNNYWEVKPLLNNLNVSISWNSLQ